MHRLSAVATHLEAAPAAGEAVVNRSVTLASNPRGTPESGDFQVLSAELPPVGDGEMLLKTRWLTLDPYMRGLDATGPMNSVKSVGRPIVGGTVSEVLESKAEGWAAGDLVVGYSGWQVRTSHRHSTQAKSRRSTVMLPRLASRSTRSARRRTCSGATRSTRSRSGTATSASPAPPWASWG